MKRPVRVFILCIPLAAMLAVWLSPLSFVPVPWPDDSAFYFVAKELFKWPPRWVMLPQAPFEPSYRIYNFNTMPLYPILIGIGRWFGIDGSFLLKLWPLGAWAATGTVFAAELFRVGLPAALVALVTFLFALDPTLRWASVLVRPESLVGLCGLGIVVGMTFGFPKRFRARGLWNPISALLALAAYAHFSAVHLVFAVVLGTLLEPGVFPALWARRLFDIAWKAALYLSPWFLMVATHWALFRRQMSVQWSRLAVGNDWLRSPGHAISSLFQSMGSPEPWPKLVNWVACGIWLLIFSAVIFGVLVPLFAKLRPPRLKKSPELLSLAPSAGWILGAIWLWNAKPEVWFTYFIHASVWCFLGFALVNAWRLLKHGQSIALAALAGLAAFSVVSFAYVDITQAEDLAQSPSWRWSTYYDFVSCVDQRLTQLEAELHPANGFHVWCPTFPDITVELSRRHPDWQLTRTNDFWSRADLAIQHGRDVEAVVVTETINLSERTISGPASEHPETQSLWMLWKGYFLNRLWVEPGWKPNRYVCQRGRWEAFLFMKSPP